MTSRFEFLDPLGDEEIAAGETVEQGRFAIIDVGQEFDLSPEEPPAGTTRPAGFVPTDQPAIIRSIDEARRCVSLDYAAKMINIDVPKDRSGVEGVTLWRVVREMEMQVRPPTIIELITREKLFINPRLMRLLTAEQPGDLSFPVASARKRQV